MNKVESPEINSRTYKHLIFDKGGTIYNGEKNSLFNKVALEKLINHV